MHFILLVSVFVLGLFFVFFWTWKAMFISAAPDQWLLLIRNGKIAQAGIGITIWRYPQDVVAVFSSTMQKVGFELEAISAENLKLKIKGFIFWSVSQENPFLAFRSLGLANLLQPPTDLKHPKHLLTSPQHKALQQVVVASVQRLASSLSSEVLLKDQDTFVSQLNLRLKNFFEPLGAKVSQLEILGVALADERLGKDSSALEEERIHEEASTIRMDTANRIRQRELEIATQKALQESEAKRDRQVREAQTALELEQERAALLERQQTVRLEQMESQAALERREKDLAHALKVDEEEKALALQSLRQKRQELELEFECSKKLKLAENGRDTGIMALQIEERKPKSMQDLEHARLTAEALARSIQVKDARWVQLTPENPLAGIASAFNSIQELLARKS